ncbi:MAG: hypothetical protein KAW14_13895 [Candidatus Aegiribacteria sp.]|nr:hypothetical protein [Candidatus Aegiribacteria sp.]
MKRFLYALLFLFIASTLADQPLVLSPRHTQGTGPIAIDGLVYSQTYVYSNLLSSISNWSGLNRWFCDDFELDSDYFVTDMSVWMIWTGEMGSMMNFVISEDDTGDSDPNTNTDIWAESVPCINIFTGDSNWGFEIYETYCTISADAYPELDAGVHYYFETQADVNDNCFILVSDNYVGDYCWYDDGSGIWVECDDVFGFPMDLFFDFYGEYLALEPETWGSIKTLF